VIAPGSACASLIFHVEQRREEREREERRENGNLDLESDRGWSIVWTCGYWGIPSEKLVSWTPVNPYKGGLVKVETQGGRPKAGFIVIGHVVSRIGAVRCSNDEYSVWTTP